MFKNDQRKRPKENYEEFFELVVITLGEALLVWWSKNPSAWDISSSEMDDQRDLLFEDISMKIRIQRDQDQRKFNRQNFINSLKIINS